MEPPPEPTTRQKKSSAPPAAASLTRVAFSLGGNHENTQKLMESALDALCASPSDPLVGGSSIADLHVSALFRTRPVSPIEQPDYLNAAVTASTGLSPADLLSLFKLCEQLHGRRRSRRWGPRPLDIDLLAYGNLVVEHPELWIPHPRLRERRFYLEPLAQIAPRLAIPPDGTTVAELLAALPQDHSRQVSWLRSTVPTVS